MNGASCRVLAGVFLFCAGVLAMWGCSTAHYRADADREVAAVIRQKSSGVPGMPTEVSIERPKRDYLKELPPAESSELKILGANTQARPLKLTLAKALEIAAMNNRDLQSRRESVYLSALALTLERHRFRPRLFGSISAQYDNDQTDESVGADTDFGFTWLLNTGGQVGVSLGSTFLKFLTGDPRRTASSLLNVSVVQPLLRGRGRSATEPLTQAERNVLYELREFVRYRRSFFVGVAADYYRVLERRQVVLNEQLNHESVVRARERVAALAAAGRLPEFQVDQTRQSELAAKEGLQAAMQRYQQALDDFKLKLALPVEAEIVLAAEELDRLMVADEEPEAPGREAAVQTALANRLDLKTAAERVEDAARRISVAEDDLLPALEMVLGASTGTSSEVKPLDLEFSETHYSAGLELDLPLDRKAERNQYRRSLIDLARARRDYEALLDLVVLQVRDSWRRFHRARSSYEIQRNSVALALRRVDMNSMLLEAGRVITRDLLEAQEALLRAQNALAGALVDYRIARLELERDMDTLKVGGDGSLEEHFEPNS